MNNGTRKTLIAGVGLAALGGIALAKRRSAADTVDGTDEMTGTVMDTGQASEPLPAVMEMPAASGLDRALSMDPGIE